MSRISSSTQRTPAALRRAERAVQEWRNNGGGVGFPIPEWIWVLAVEAARVVGVAEVVRVLRLNRQRLKQRLAAEAPVPVADQAETADIEHVPEDVVAADVNPDADEQPSINRDQRAAPMAAQPRSTPPFLVPTSGIDAEPDASPTFFELRLPAADPEGLEPPAADRVSEQTRAVIECSGHGEHLRIELHTVSAATVTGIVQAFWSRSCSR